MQSNILYSDTGNGVFCSYMTSERFYMPNFHAHVQYEYLYIRQGTLIVESNADKEKVKGPCVIIHKPYTLHKAYTHDEHEGIYERYVINFKENLLMDFVKYFENLDRIKGFGMIVIQIDERVSEYLKRCYEDVMEANRKTEYHRSILILALITDTLIRCMEESEPKKTSSHIKYIYEIVQYISENLHLNLTLEEIADKFFISRAKLVADFKAVTGMSVKKYVTLMKVNAAITMLRNGLSVSDTAEACGFCDDSHFIITFKTYTDMTPKEYMRKKSGEYKF